MTSVLGRTHRLRPALAFLRHLAEMLAAMAVGMVTLYPLWRFALTAAGSPAWAEPIEVNLTVMATTMTVAMAAWMRYRGHRARPIAEMSASMYTAFVVLFPLHWAGALDAMGVMMWGHVLMPVFMIAAMTARRGEYTHPHTPREKR
jgi:flagellar biosynthetic protein FliP